MITKRVKKAVLKLNFQIPYYLLKIKISLLISYYFVFVMEIKIV